MAELSKNYVYESIRSALRKIIFKAGYQIVYPTVPEIPNTLEVLAQKNRRTYRFVVGDLRAGTGVYINFYRLKKRDVKEKHMWHPMEGTLAGDIENYVFHKLSNITSPEVDEVGSTGWLDRVVDSMCRKSKKDRRRSKNWANGSKWKAKETVPDPPLAELIED